jgi:hypothetical protein
MVVWGGESGNFVNQRSTGGIYDPTTDRWTATSGLDAPLPRAGHSAVWTGTEMIIWGGRKGSGSADAFNSGARFDPVLNAWTPIARSSAPKPTSGHTAVWTGNRMLVWGTTRIGGRYDASTNSWTPISLGSTATIAVSIPRFGPGP